MDYEQSIEWIRSRAEVQRSIARHDLRMKSDAVCKELGVQTMGRTAYERLTQSYRDLGAAAQQVADTLRKFNAAPLRGLEESTREGFSGLQASI